MFVCHRNWGIYQFPKCHDAIAPAWYSMLGKKLDESDCRAILGSKYSVQYLLLFVLTS